MFLRLEPTSSEPLFEQVVFGVKSAVASGTLAAGARLPSVRELAKELVINPNTVARAYAELEGQGVIVRRQGSGCFVSPGDCRLSERERERRLGALVERLVIEAFHLGFDPDAVRAALDARLAAHSGARRSEP
jgi:GntR family transcriptional regulator